MPEWLYPVAGFAGGVLGAAIGALPAFVLCGVAIVAGTVIFMITGDRTFLTVVTWGPVLGPHAAFAGGVAAAAFAARRGRLPSGRDILTPLASLKSSPVLAIGGLFGCLGVLLAAALSRIPAAGPIPWINPIALSIALNGLLVRLLLGRSGLLGRVGDGQSRFFPSDGSGAFPWHLPPLTLLTLSAGVSLPVALVAASFPGSAGLAFGIAAVALGLLAAGIRMPVLIHTVLATELYAAVTGSVGWGVALGVLAAILAEGSACLFLIHGDTHVDPPALSLVLVFAAYPVLDRTGALEASGAWPLMAVAALALMAWRRRSPLRGHPPHARRVIPT